MIFKTIKRQEQAERILLLAKKFISWVLGIPALIIIVGESDDLNIFWLKLIATFIMIAILKWNHILDSK